MRAGGIAMFKVLGFLLISAIVLVVAAAGGAVLVFQKYGSDLPDYGQLATYEPPITTRVHAADGRLISEFATEKRVFVPVVAMPKRVIQAFLAAEDDTFYTHPGIDFRGIVGAALTNIANMGENRRPVGASTITQQVAKNFLLSSEVSFDRKIKEAILAFRIEKVLSKDRILELYLNEIYLGQGSYGVVAAAQNYFNKPLDMLTLEEAAFLAGLPKAPNNYNPVRFPEAAMARRNYVLGRMATVNYISTSEAQLASAVPLRMTPRQDENIRAPHFSEEVRRIVLARYGEAGLYQGGLSVRTTLEPRLQEIATASLRKGLTSYDRRHGWRGPVARIAIGTNWAQQLGALEPPKGLGPWTLGVVLGVDDKAATVGLANGSRGTIPLAEMTWARAHTDGERLGPRVNKPADVVAIGDVVPVERIEGAPEGTFALRQIPAAQGSLVAIDPHTGRVVAMVGGFSYDQSEFNRATQAMRQPGSAFKPFVYIAALENGFTPSSKVLDAPFVFDQGPGLPLWKPENYSRQFYGPSTLRLGIEKSRNLMTVRLAQFVGMDKVADYARRFGVIEKMPQMLSMSLGAGETTLLRLTTGYAMIVNGGKKIEPTLIDRVQDRNGKTIYRHDSRPCPNCVQAAWTNQPEPAIADTREQIVDPAVAYQMVSMLQGVVDRGTGASIREVGKTLGGKTGTSDESKDTWFVGFSADLAVGVFVGFDHPKSLGKTEQGASTAAPIFKDFMAAALAETPDVPFRIPAGVRLVRVDAESGLPARVGSGKTILEAFRPGSEPTDNMATLDGPLGTSAEGNEGGSDSGRSVFRPAATPVTGSAVMGTGGLY